MPKKAAEAEPPIYACPGMLTMKVGMKVLDAQRAFGQALHLTYASHHAEAQQAYRVAQARDPACALWWWREALVLGPTTTPR